MGIIQIKNPQINLQFPKYKTMYIITKLEDFFVGGKIAPILHSLTSFCAKKKSRKIHISHG